jgi:hypothetical protein
LQFPEVLGHGRSQGAGKKKGEREGNPFYTLLAAGMHHGGQSRSRKKRRQSVPWRWRTADGGTREIGRQGGPRVGGWQRSRRGTSGGSAQARA